MFDIAACASSSPDFSGAEIEEAINSALYDAFYARQEVTTEHILRTISQTVPLAKTMDEQVRRLREWSKGRASPAAYRFSDPTTALTCKAAGQREHFWVCTIVI